MSRGAWMRVELVPALVGSLMMASICFAQGDPLALAEPDSGDARDRAMARDDAGGTHLEADLRFRTREWNAEVEGNAWFAALLGTMTLPGGSEFDLEDVDLDEARLTPVLEARLRFGDWQVDASALFFEFEDDARADASFDAGDFIVARGDEVDSEFRYTQVHLRVGRRLWTADLTDASLATPGGVAPPSPGVNLDIEGFIGVRVTDLDYTLEVIDGIGAGQRVEVDELWVEPTLGVALRIDFESRATIDIATNFGGWSSGGDTSLSWDIAASVGYAWTNHVQTSFGFRHIRTAYEADDDGFERDGFLAGLFAAVTIRF